MYFDPWVIFFGMGNVNPSYVLILFFIDHNNTYAFVSLFI